MTDVLMRSVRASEYRDQIMALLDRDELIYNALDAQADIGAKRNVSCIVLVTSRRLLFLSPKRRGRIDVAGELPWSDVSRSGMGTTPSGPAVLFSRRSGPLKWVIHSGGYRDEGLADKFALLAATVEEARNAHAQATTSKLSGDMGELRKQRGF